MAVLDVALADGLVVGLLLGVDDGELPLAAEPLVELVPVGDPLPVGDEEPVGDPDPVGEPALGDVLVGDGDDVAAPADGVEVAAVPELAPAPALPAIVPVTSTR